MSDRSFEPIHRLFASADLRRLFPEKPNARPAGLMIDMHDAGRQDESADDDDGDEPFDAPHDELSGTNALARRIRQLETLHVLSTGLTHDLNNLFQVATSALRLITLRLEQGRVDDALRLIAKAEMALQRGGTIVESLTTLPAHPASYQRLVDVNSTIRSLEGLLRILTGPKIELRLNLPDEDFTVPCDVLEFENALINLVTNARNAILGAGRVTIATSRQRLAQTADAAGATNYIAVTVLDNGRGMTPEVSARVFDPFYSTGTGQSSGLGLAMVQRLLDQVGGRSSLQSVPGIGTSVTMIFPSTDRGDEQHA